MNKNVRQGITHLAVVLVVLVLCVGVVQAGMAQVNYRRPPLRRVFKRTY